MFAVFVSVCSRHKIIISQNGKRLSSFNIWLIEQSVVGLLGMGGVRGRGGRGRGKWGVGGWVAASVARWPEFRPKSSKGAGEKKLTGRICGPKLAKHFPELAELFSCTGGKIISGPGNTGSSILYTRQQLSTVLLISQIINDDLCLPF